MVGFEPDLNEKKDWVKIWAKHMQIDDLPEESDAVEVTSLGMPCEVENGALSSPSIKPCNTRKDISYHLRQYQYDDYKDRLAMPVIQVLSVCISTKFGDGKPCEIHGSIQALGDDYPRLDLYNRDPKDSETILEHGTLSLIGPKGDAIIPSFSTTLDLNLKDRIHGVEIVNELLNLDPMAEDSYDRLLKSEVDCAHGTAYVYYVVFPFATYCSVQVIVTKNDNDEKSSSNVAEIYGSIVATYDNGGKYAGDEDIKWVETLLFERPQNQPLRVMVETPMSLPKNVVIVPAYSSFAIEVNLWDSSGKIASECLQFPAYRSCTKPIYIQTQYARFEVQVRWNNAYLYLYRNRLMESSNRRELCNGRGEMQKKPGVLNDLHLSDAIIPRRGPQAYFGTVGVEVFSVFVGGISENISTLSGAILISDGADTFSIYNRVDSCSELLSDNGLASIEVNYRAIKNIDFGIQLYLRDPVGNLEVSRGSLGWHVGSLMANMSWYSKRLCTVVRGDDGFAAVHYEVFRDAYEALLEVKLLHDHGHPDFPINLCGTLLARYNDNDYDYSTSYHKKYYTSRLFDRPRDKPVKLKVGSRIAMLKSIVVVPAYSSLVIEANLSTLGIDGVDESICEEAEFEIKMGSKISKTIRGRRYSIEVNVKFYH